MGMLVGDGDERVDFFVVVVWFVGRDDQRGGVWREEGRKESMLRHSRRSSNPPRHSTPQCPTFSLGLGGRPGVNHLLALPTRPFFFQGEIPFFSSIFSVFVFYFYN